MTLRTAVPALALLLCLPATAGASTVAGRVPAGSCRSRATASPAVRAVGVEEPGDHGRRQGAQAPLPPDGAGRPLLALRRDDAVQRQARRRPRRRSRPAAQGQAQDGADLAAQAQADEAPEGPEAAEDPAHRERGVRDGQAPAVWIQHFSVTGGGADLQVLEKGIPQMLTSDLVPPIQQACKGVIVEREKLKEILPEIASARARWPTRARACVGQDHRAQPRGGREPERRRRDDDAERQMKNVKTGDGGPSPAAARLTGSSSSSSPSCRRPHG